MKMKLCCIPLSLGTKYLLCKLAAKKILSIFLCGSQINLHGVSIEIGFDINLVIVSFTDIVNSIVINFVFEFVRLWRDQVDWRLVRLTALVVRDF